MNSPDTTYTTFEVSMVEDVKPEQSYLEEILGTETPQNLDDIQDQSGERTDKSDWSEEAINILVTQVKELSPQLGTIFGLKTKQEMWSVISTMLCNKGHMYTSKQVQNKFYYLERHHKKAEVKKDREMYIARSYEIDQAEMAEDRGSEVFRKVEETLDWSEQESLDSQVHNDTVQTLTSVKVDKQFWSDMPTQIVLRLMKELLPQVGTTFELKTKKKMFDVISKKLCEEGYMFTGQQVDTRFTSLERRYRKLNRLNEFAKSWPYESDVAELIGERTRKQTDIDRGITPTALIHDKNTYTLRTSQQKHEDFSVQMTVETENDRDSYATKDQTCSTKAPNFQGIFLPLQQEHGASRMEDDSVCFEQQDSQESIVKVLPANNHLNPSFGKNKQDVSTSTKVDKNFISKNEDAGCSGSCGARCISGSKVANGKLRKKMALLSKKYDDISKSNKEFEDRVLNYLERKEERAKRKEQLAEREETRKKRKLELFEKLVERFCD